jgi:exosortase/archaeosortase family protein
MTTANATSMPLAAIDDLPKLSAWLRLPVLLPLTLWGIEVGLLSPQVEFKSGAMTYIAHPLTANLLFLATVLFLLLAGDRLRVRQRVQWSWHRWAWMAANLVGYGLLFLATLQLQDMPAQGKRFWLSAAAWAGLVMWVGVTAWLAFVPARRLVAWLSDSWEKAIGAGLLAFTLVLVTPEIRRLWYFIYEPIVGLTLKLLNLAGYTELVCYVSAGSGNPVFGSRDAVVLEVTPNCAEVESLAVFCLLGGALLVTGWRRIYRTRFCVVLLAGLGLLYFLNALRLYLLIDVAARLHDANVAVSLAHSRLSHVFFLALSLVILIGTRRWWDRGATTTPAALPTTVA